MDIQHSLRRQQNATLRMAIPGNQGACFSSRTWMLSERETGTLARLITPKSVKIDHLSLKPQAPRPVDIDPGRPPLVACAMPIRARFSRRTGHVRLRNPTKYPGGLVHSVLPGHPSSEITQ